MKLTINGKDRSIDAYKPTVTELLALEKVGAPEMVSVQINGTILGREQFETTRVSENDVVEFLYFMGGGRAMSGGNRVNPGQY